jgi:hypothetical protein
VLPDFSEQRGSGTGSTQPREQFEELLGRNCSGSARLPRSAILRLIVGKYKGMIWVKFMYLRIWTIGGSDEHWNEPSGSIKCRKIVE